MTRKIYVIATDAAACFYYRLHLPLTRLNPAEFQVIWAPPDHPTSLQPGDVVIGQRIAGLNTAWREMCERPGVLSVYDIDDNLLEIDPANTVPFQIYAPQAEDTALNIQAASVVTCPTPALRHCLSHLNSRIEVLPNCIDPATLASVKMPHDEIIVGWAGSMFHHQDWHDLPTQLVEYARAEPRARFHMIGANYVAGAVPTRFTGWTTMDRYWAAMDFDIGVAPLSHTVFNACKSWIKVLEYAAQGVPAVATNIGQYQDFIEHGINGFLVGDNERWVEYLIALSDDTFRAQMSDAAQAKASEWTIDKQVSRWEAVYRME